MLSTAWKRATYYTAEKRPKLLSSRTLRTYITLLFLLFSLISLFYCREHVRLLPDPVSANKEPQPKPDPHPELTLQLDAPRCGGELDLLKDKELDISARVKYTRRCIKPVYTGSWDHEGVHNFTSNLIPDRSEFRVVELDKCIQQQYEDATECSETIRVEVPKPYPQRTYPDFVFAIATNFKRLQYFRSAFAQWMGHSDAKLLATVIDKEGETMSGTQLREEEKRWEDLGMNMKILHQRQKDDSVTQVHMVMVQDAVDAATVRTEWIGILDDDTFFPHFFPLWKALQDYDPAKPWYIGAPSEQLQTINSFGMNAFGGAGIFLSMPLAKQIAPVARDCLSVKTHGGRIPIEGDTLMAECVYHYTTTKLTWMRGLWQLDLHGNPDGFFESGRKVISLHHWKKGSGWAAAPVVAMSKITELCGDCFLSRWRAGLRDVFTAGYSIVKYNKGNDQVDLDKMEATFKQDWDYGFSLGPFRERLERNDKKTYKIVASGKREHKVEGGENGLKETYVYKGDRRRGEVDEVVEVVWQDPEAQGWMEW
ncbi:putative glycosyltransferase family 31 protein [Zalerion maritima]|uniref:Glycosyltransferase family 31 protein n=1 Tax=Zalerion maritima TaxID=339359 RepID=A0AAD5RJB2_9PEZI|nr:putative glycosyltransferase family 31 protein [Zalerion maritima]